MAFIGEGVFAAAQTPLYYSHFIPPAQAIDQRRKRLGGMGRHEVGRYDGRRRLSSRALPPWASTGPIFCGSRPPKQASCAGSGIEPGPIAAPGLVPSVARSRIRGSTDEAGASPKARIAASPTTDVRVIFILCVPGRLNLVLGERAWARAGHELALTETDARRSENAFALRAFSLPSP